MNRKVTTTVLFLAVCFTSTAVWSANVTGRVFLDDNRNGVADSGEAGIAGCMVSDGRRLVQTDENGDYRLTDVAAPAVVFVVNRPDTWPTGPWWMHLAEDEGQESVDFALGPQQQSGPLYFVQGTDMHLRPDAVSMYRTYVEHVNGLPVPVAFVVHTGDLVVDALRSTPGGAAKLFDLYGRASDDLAAPRRDVIGNHEHVGLARPDVDAKHPDYGKGMYRRLFGPTTYAFRWGRYHFIALDGSTIDPSRPTGYGDGLDAASADWATGYLETLAGGEPVVLLVHQPLGNTPTVKRLSKALQGKRLLLTLWGHGHGRRVSQFGGAPAVMGGAVSSPWHGFVPYPPNPRSHVLVRLEDDTVHFVFLDWAYDRAIDVLRPAWEQPLAGSVEFEVAVSDPDGSLGGLSCRLADRSFAGRRLSTGKLAAKYGLTVDTAGLPDGVYDLVFVTHDAGGQEEQPRPVVVHGGEPGSFEAPGPVVLQCEIRGSSREGGEVLVNGRAVGALPVSEESWQKVSIRLEPESLRRLNEITLRAAEGDCFEVRRLQLNLDGRACRDVRFAASRPRRSARSSDGKRSELVFFLDPTYRGPRGQ